METILSLKKNWFCAKCETAKRALPANERPASHTFPAIPAALPSPAATDPISAIAAQLNALAKEVGVIKSSVRKDIMAEIKGLKESVDKVGEQSFANSQRLSEIENKLAAQNKLFEELSLENRHLKAKVAELEVGLNRAEQDLRSKNVEIRGIPVRGGESPAGLVTAIGASLGLKLSPDDLDTVERLRPRRDDPRPPVIVAKFVKQATRDELVRLKKVKRDLTTRDLGWTDNEVHKVYVSEDMSPTNRRLYYLARQRKAAGRLKYVWFGGGRVRCRQDDGRPVHIINIPEDLDMFR